MNAPTIILVDDDLDKQFLLKRLLNKQFPGNETTVVNNFDAALPLLRTSYSKIVVTNGRISGESGIEFASFITREIHAPVIMVSLREELKQKALDAGVLAFVEMGDELAIREAVSRAIESVAK